MADPFISVLVERLFAAVEAMVSEEISLVMGAKKEAQKLAITMKGIQSVLNDAEDRRVEESVKFWLEQLQEVFYDMDNVIDDWNTEALKRKIEIDDEANVAAVSSQINPENKVRRCSFPSPFSCFKRVSTRRGIALAIKELNERLEFISKSKDKLNLLPVKVIDDESEKFKRIQTSSLIDESDVCGRDIEKESLISKLLLDNNGKSINVISIVGTGGLGKTTLAQLAFNDDRIKSLFDHRVWVCVSDPFDEIQVAKKFIESVTGSTTSLTSVDLLLREIKELVSGKRILLVLDDVWPHERQKWEQLRISLKDVIPPSKVLMTTRDRGVALSMGTNHFQALDVLSDFDCWSLICKIALPDKSELERSEFEEYGKKISERCKGLPLAAKTIGSVLLLKDRVQGWRGILESKIWELNVVKVDLFPHLFLSFSHLPLAVRRCFKYCAIFPKDYRIQVDDLIWMWMSQGYIQFGKDVIDRSQDKGYEYVESLVRCSFFQEVRINDFNGKIYSFKIHDIVHDFALYLMEKECLVMDGGNSSRTEEENNMQFRHLVLPQSFEAIALAHISGVEKLQTFFAPDVLLNVNVVDTEILATFLGRLRNVKCLTLRNCSLEKLPGEIKLLTHLRYLDLSRNYKLIELSEEVCDLCNLETLDITCCPYISKLPEGIKKLINLRHLLIDEPIVVPKVLLKLTKLQTLTMFKVGEEYFKLRDLGCLTQLEGYLNIRFYDETCEVFEDGAVLQNHKKITSLRLSNPQDKRKYRIDFLDGLESPPNLDSLILVNFRFDCADWIGMSPFCNVRNLGLSQCSWQSFPLLWKMQHLERLSISFCNDLEHMGLDLFGMEINSGDNENNNNDSERNPSPPPSSSSSLPTTIVAFPKLKLLEFHGCWNWKEWEDIAPTTTEGDDDDVISSSSRMPCLEELRLTFCPSLVDLPHQLLSTLPNLKRLDITCSAHLLKKYQKDEEWVKMPWLSRVTVATTFLDL